MKLEEYSMVNHVGMSYNDINFIGIGNFWMYNESKQVPVDRS